MSSKSKKKGKIEKEVKTLISSRKRKRSSTKKDRKSSSSLTRQAWSKNKRTEYKELQPILNSNKKSSKKKSNKKKKTLPDITESFKDEQHEHSHAVRSQLLMEQSMIDVLTSNAKFKSKYKIVDSQQVLKGYQKCIGAGAHSCVFYANRISDHSKWAVKAENASLPMAFLHIESNSIRKFKQVKDHYYTKENEFVTRLITECESFTKLRISDHDGDGFCLSALVLPFFQCTLKHFLNHIVFENKHDRDDLDENSNFFIHLRRELMLCVRDLFLCEFVHRDIKPENIMVSFDKNEDFFENPTFKCTLIDYGCGSFLSSILKRNEIQSKRKRAHPMGEVNYGTSEFASISSHKGVMQTYSDDIEGMSYVLLYCLKGKLPWQSLKSTSSVLICKENNARLNPLIIQKMIQIANKYKDQDQMSLEVFDTLLEL
jgi:hypothetical protein